MSFPASAAPFCSFSVEFSTFSCCFQNVFHFPAANFPLAAEFFRFLQLPAKWELHALSFLSPLCECVAGSQIGHLLCEDCKFLIHVRRCHTIRITRKASLPCVPAGKNGAVDHFRAQVPPQPDWPERGLYHPLRGGLMCRASACIRLAGIGR